MTEENVEKTVAVILRKAPYGLMYGFEGLRAIMGISIFEMQVVPILMNDGVYAAMANQDPSDIDMNPLGESFENLDDFGVHAVYVHKESMEKRGVRQEDLVEGPIVTDTERLKEIMAEVDLILPF